MRRTFERAELAFFVVPRNWREIEMRFGAEAKTEEFREAIILHDDEGGSGMFHYLHPKRSWVLTEAGKQAAGQRVLTRELRVYPDRRTPREREQDDHDLREAFAGLANIPGPLDEETIGKAVGEPEDPLVPEGAVLLEELYDQPRLEVVEPEGTLVPLTREEEIARLVSEQEEDDG